MYIAGKAILGGLVLATSAQAALTDGFKNAKTFSSQGGLANCVAGDVPIQVSSNKNVVLKTTIPKNQYELTQLIVSTYSTEIGDTLMKSVIGPAHDVQGNFSIYSVLCVPKSSSNGSKGKAIQFLTHGIGADYTYWDFAPGNSYVDVAAKAGASTFSYDRLGVGKSSTPDPLQVVQVPLHVEVAHTLMQKLKAGDFASTKYSKVVGTGHSLGSAITAGVTSQYPKAFDAAVLTGFSVNRTGVPLFWSALDGQIANQNNPQRFGNLNNGYLVAQSAISNQFDFLHYPGFKPSILDQLERTKGTITVGEFFTMGLPVPPATKFTGPVDVVDGAFDIPFCNGNCRAPVDKAAQVLKEFYPKAGKGSTSVIIPAAGHGLNLQNTATQAFDQIQKFVTDHGL